MAGVRQFDEEQAFADALSAFWRKGYRATSMLDLAEATGVLRGSLYNAYGDKEEIFIRVFERYTAEFMTGVRAALNKSNLRAALVAFFNFTIGSISQGSPARGCLSTKTAIELDPDSPRIRASLRTMLDELEFVLLSRLDQPDTREQLVIPPRQAAKLIVTTTRGIAVMERVYCDPKSLRQTATALINAIVPEQS
jgi:TetR/AcrR family transcriptional regulator, transcriptional repressor for nem operon